MADKYSKQSVIASYHVDGTQKLRPASFMALAQEMAFEAATALSFGHAELAKHNLAWVLSRAHIEFDQAPVWQEKVDFKTWHKGIDGLFFIRDYHLLSEDGSSRVRGTSSWLVIDTESRRLFRTDRLCEMFDLTPQNTDNAVETPAGKIVLPKGVGPELVDTHVVKYSDVDFIGHANNTSYISWAMDCMPEGLGFPKSFDINFTLETKYGEEVELYRTVEKTECGTEVCVEGRVGGRAHFTSKFVFED